MQLTIIVVDYYPQSFYIHLTAQYAFYACNIDTLISGIHYHLATQTTKIIVNTDVFSDYTKHACMLLNKNMIVVLLM